MAPFIARKRWRQLLANLLVSCYISIMGRPSTAMREYAESAAHPTMRVIATIALRQRKQQPLLAGARNVAESTVQRNFESQQPTPKVVLEYCEILGIRGPAARALADTLEAQDYAQALRDLRDAMGMSLNVTDDVFARFEPLAQKTATES